YLCGGGGGAQRVDAVERRPRVVERDAGAVDGDLLSIGIEAGDDRPDLDLGARDDADLGQATGAVGLDDDGAFGTAGAERGQAVVDGLRGDFGGDDGRLAVAAVGPDGGLTAAG